MARYTQILLALLWMYTSNLQAQQVSAQQQQDDFDTLCVMLETIHPDLLAYQSVSQYNERRDSIRTSLVKDRSVSDFYLSIAPFVASIKDGHTNITPPATKDRMEYLKNGGLTLPLRVKPENGKLVVDFPLTTCSIQPGDEITRINGISADTLLRKLYDLLGAEKGDAIKDKQLTPYLSTLLWYQYGWGEEYDFQIKRQQEIWEESLKGISQSEVLSAMREKSAKPLPPFTASISPDRQTAELRIANFFQLPELKQFCDSLFLQINAEKIPHLIIDVRNNGGGSSAGVDLLLSYLSHDMYTLYPRSELKVNKYTKAYHQKNHPEIYESIKDLPDGTIFPISDESVTGNRDNPNTYKGDVTILVDETTYSGASTFAHTIEKSNAGKVIGETGCPSVYTGNILLFKLPNSQLEYYIAFTKFHEAL